MVRLHRLSAAAGIGALNVMGLKSPQSAILAALIYNALIIPALIPLALKGVEFRPLTSDQLLRRNILIYGLGGVIAPFIAIKLIDLMLPFSFTLRLMGLIRHKNIDLHIIATNK